MKQKLIVVAALAVLVASCTPYQQQGAAVGGVAGGLLGAATGRDSGSTLKGAALGAGLGTGIAAWQENQRRDSGYNTPPPPPNNGNYPYAERTSTRGQVISPYAPYNVIDVRGMRSGGKAIDPSCNKVFIIP